MTKALRYSSKLTKTYPRKVFLPRIENPTPLYPSTCYVWFYDIKCNRC